MSTNDTPSNPSPTSRPGASDPSSSSDQRLGSAINPHAPANPSQLRESHRPPSTPTSAAQELGEDSVYFQQSDEHEFTSAAPIDSSGIASELPNELRQRAVYGYPYDSRDPSRSPSPDVSSTPATPYFYRAAGSTSHETTHGLHGATSRLFGETIKPSTGDKHSWLLYLNYYVPLTGWITEYKLSYLLGDIVGAFTMASFYIPVSLSYASQLAHIPPINGLYAFATRCFIEQTLPASLDLAACVTDCPRVNPLLYAVFGTCPQMVVGPEAAGSLLTGNVVRDSINKGKARDEDGMVLAETAGTVTGIAGAILLIAGIARIGFLDNVLSRSFLRGFISAIGFVIICDQLIPELGLSELASEVGGVLHGSCVEKIIFLVTNIKSSHGLTAAVGLGTFAVTMICREIKRRLQSRFPRVAYIPDRFLIVVITTLMCWELDWAGRGVAIMGNVQDDRVRPFTPSNPFDFSKVKHLETSLSTSFVIALLGFFESSVAAKSLGAAPKDGIQNLRLSANRELVALGVANVVGGVFMGIPAFGGYGRSKLNASTGGKTPMSSVFLSLITIFSVFFLLPAFHYIPRGVLSAMISVVAWTLLEEAPYDLKFFWRIRGWTELLLICIVFFSTIFYSLEVGIACGIGFSLLRVIKHATRPRIQILGRARGTDDHFENAEADPERYEFIEGCLIVKMPEPLTFANTGDLRSRLNRLMEYGTESAHPALPRMRESHNNKNIIFDVHGVTGLDGAGAQILAEILSSYREKGVRIFFCRLPSSRLKVWTLFEKAGIVDICGGPRHFVSSVKEALRLTELESLTEEFREYSDNPEV